MKKIYVGNLPFSMQEGDLEGIFANYGPVTSVKIVTDRYSGRSRGFGFIEMEDDTAAGQAIEELNGKDCEGRALTVNEARPREDRGPR